MALTIFLMALAVLAWATSVGRWRAPPPLPAPTLEEIVARYFPALESSELAALHPSERDITPFRRAPQSAQFVRQPSETVRVSETGRSMGPYHHYVSAPGHEVRVDTALPPPDVEIDLSEPMHPQLGSRAVSAALNVSYYYEFDTDPTFESPNFWRYPALQPDNTAPDRTSRRGLSYRLFQSSLRDATGARSLRFPFRASVMGLTRAEPATFRDLAKYAQLIGYGLGHDRIIREVFEVVRMTNIWADETSKRRPIDTFIAGVGECVHANEFAGTLLEINSIRQRTVGGVNPRARLVYRGSGHAAIEAMNSRGHWGYVDPYLDIYAQGTAARELDHHPIGSTKIFEIDATASANGGSVSLADLFKYRVYSDEGDRLPPATMLQLRGDEDRYGRDWALRRLAADETLNIDVDVPLDLTIFVRARYVVSLCRIKSSGCSDVQAVASPWSTRSFALPIRTLLSFRQ